jgi:hypothetical protein
MGKPYNGHPSYNAWNVSLWINNDYDLYCFARSLRRSHTSKKAAERFIETMAVHGKTKTPDGVPYTVTNVRLAMQGMV